MKKRAGKEVARAARLYKKFREQAPRRALRVQVRIPKAVTVMGYLRAVEYDTTHLDDEGKRLVGQGYRHTFAPGSRPLLCAVPGKPGQLFVIGGRFHITERGIVDLDPKGKEIED